MLKTNTVNTIALLSICISFWNALYKKIPFFQQWHENAVTGQEHKKVVDKNSCWGI